MWLALALGACVTINVYFPAAAAEKAADRIIEEVWGKTPGAKGEKKPGEQSSDSGVAEQVLSAIMQLLVPAARAQQADLDISTAAIRKVTASMEARHAKLLVFWNSGAIGLTADGLVAVRDPKAIALNQRRLVNQLVASENRDRNALYREIARANGHPEWERDIRRTFARRWIGRAGAGWWYRSAEGWVRK